MYKKYASYYLFKKEGFSIASRLMGILWFASSCVAITVDLRKICFYHLTEDKKNLKFCGVI